jgi:hypothetical protein
VKGSAPDLSANNAKKIALAQGNLARKELELSDGGSLSAEAMANVLGKSQQGLAQLRRTGRLVAWLTAQGEWRYPAWQLNTDKQLFPGIRECLRALNTRSQWEPLIFFLSPRDSLEGKRPLDLLRIGRIDEAVAAAERHGGHGAY